MFLFLSTILGSKCSYFAIYSFKVLWLKIDFKDLPVFMYAQFLVQERVYMQDTSF